MPAEIFETVADVAPEIREGLPGRRTEADQENVTGDEQLAADIWADEVLCDRLSELDSVGAYASEEREDIVDAGSGFSVAVDPLDGSSNLKSNNPMGIIVGVYDATLPAAGRKLIGAAYVLFGPITTMVTASAGRAMSWVIEADGTRGSVGTVDLPEEPTVYGFGGRVPEWSADFEAHVRSVEQDLKLRYGGAMIADVSQVLTHGGIFGYPALESRPDGKLRLLFEGAPMAYIVEAAGGASSDGTDSLLAVEPDALHQRTPVFVGNTGCIERLEAALD